ncbi:hypothetical protein Q7P37_005895 [Cladosporium fusiforme]
MSQEAQQTAKKALRKDLKTRLSSLTPTQITTQSQSAQSLILSLPAYQRAKSLSIYLSMPAAEAQTDLLVRDALKAGKKVFVPFLYTPAQAGGDEGVASVEMGEKKKKPRKVMDLLRLREGEFEALGRDAWGIPSLGEDGVEGRENAMGGVGLSLGGGGEGSQGQEDLGWLDLVVVPAVAFDKQMNRLGHGAGFYDAFLARFCEGGKREKPYLVGLCLAEQILGEEHKIPTADWDWKVDAVAVGDGTLLA